VRGNVVTVRDPDRWSHPVPGRTGWSQRTEGPLWQRREWWRPWARRNRLTPYCRMVRGGARADCLLGHRVAPIPQNVQTPPCRTFPDFPCCQRPTRFRRHWLTRGHFWEPW
jgi:hypothetical protein